MVRKLRGRWPSVSSRAATPAYHPYQGPGSRLPIPGTPLKLAAPVPRSLLVSPTSRLLVALLAGLALGALLPRLGAIPSARVVGLIEPVGVLWVNAVRMTVIPMVVSLLIVGIAGTSDVRAIGRIGTRALVACLTMLAVAAVCMALVAPPLM